MIQGMYSSASGMIAQQTSVDNTANNLANVNTAGFKRGEISFQDVLGQTDQPPGGAVQGGVPVPTGVQVGSGARVAAISKVFSQGPLENTGNPLNVAIQGEGFFQVAFLDGTNRYTRDGSFQVTAEGTLVNSSGFPLVPPITIPQDALSVTIGTNGVVTVQTAGAPGAVTQVGAIALARFPNPSGLNSQGNNLYAESPASGGPLVGAPGAEGNGTLFQGFLEGSNVEPVREMVNLLAARQFFTANSRPIRVIDEMLSVANQLIR